jgi:hypothetical protein
MADSPNPSSGDLPAGSGGSPEKPVLTDRRVAALSGAGAGARYKAMSPARLPISREPCLTIPAGFSPGALLESPVLLNNFKVITAPHHPRHSLLLRDLRILPPPCHAEVDSGHAKRDSDAH